MDGNFGLRLLLMLFIVGMNAFFAASEVALVSSRLSRLKAFADEGNLGAQAALNLLSNSERLLSVVQVGVTLCSIALGVAGEQALQDFFTGLFGFVPQGSVWQAVSTGVSIVLAYLLMTFLHVVIGEVVPKNLAIEKSEALAVVVAPVLLVFHRVVTPFVYVLERSSAAVSRMLGLKGERQGGHSVEELRYILSTFQREGEGPGPEIAMQRLLDLPELLTREIMVPRNQLVTISVDISLEALLRVANEHQFTRLPVYEQRTENIIGYVHVKDMLRVWQERLIAIERRRPIRDFDLRRLLRRLPIVPESKPVVQLIEEFRRTHSHMALVVDEFGTAAGVVTFEDVVEQVFGEIEDEHDIRRPDVQKAAPVIHVEGTIPIRDLEMHYGIELPTDAGFETLAGFLLYKLGYIPKAGEAVEEDGRKYTIEEMDRNRIVRVRVERKENAETGV